MNVVIRPTCSEVHREDTRIIMDLAQQLDRIKLALDHAKKLLKEEVLLNKYIHPEIELEILMCSIDNIVIGSEKK